MIRLFIAFPLEKPVIQKLGKIIDDLKVLTDEVRWVSPENIHLTARFLGDTDEKKIPTLKGLIDSIASNGSVTTCTMSRIGAFPNLTKPRVIWVGFDSQSDELARMAKNLEVQVRQLNIPSEPKPFRAHLTLGRVKEDKNIGLLLDRIPQYVVEPTKVKFDRLALFKSTLTPKGSVFELLHESRLLGKKS
jgi:RNA 2',3'-cyclic 3'-phosphodiesterase